MARKDIFSSVMNPAPPKAERNEALSYVVNGASRSIKSSFEELAKGSVVELDPDTRRQFIRCRPARPGR